MARGTNAQETVAATSVQAPNSIQVVASTTVPPGSYGVQWRRAVGGAHLSILASQEDMLLGHVSLLERGRKHCP